MGPFLPSADEEEIRSIFTIVVKTRIAVQTRAHSNPLRRNVLWAHPS
ncbi:MAG: hypothetical protein WKF76_13265 [Nocardioidaceae bacterium]